MNMVESFVKSCMSQVVREFHLCYRVTWRDIPVAVITGCAFTSSAAIRKGYYYLSDYLCLMPWTVLYFFLFVYSFNLCNQIAGVEEDKIDKPDRPIPSGMLTLTGAKYRWYTVTTLYVLANITIGNLWSPFLWIIITLMNSYGGWDKHWFTKNCVCMTLGTLAISWAGWSIVNGHVWMDQKYVTITTVLSLYAGVTANLQDLRDVEGDRKSGRIMMPICYGMSTSRQLLSIVFLIEPVILYFTVWNSPFLKQQQLR